MACTEPAYPRFFITVNFDCCVYYKSEPVSNLIPKPVFNFNPEAVQIHLSANYDY